MVTSTESPQALREIKISWNIFDKGRYWDGGDGTAMLYAKLRCNLSKLERFAVHRGLRKFEVEVDTTALRVNDSRVRHRSPKMIQTMKTEFQRVRKLIVPEGLEMVATSPSSNPPQQVKTDLCLVQKIDR